MVARSTPHTRTRLLKHGLALARRSGLRALTVRGVAAQADVNLGSFVHHFGSRDAFVAEVLALWYAPLMQALTAPLPAADGALDRLRHRLLQLTGWLRQHHRFIAQILIDAAAGERAARRFLAGLESAHPALILAAIVDAQKAGALRREDPAHVLLFLMSTLGLPMILMHGVGLAKLMPAGLGQAFAPLAIEPQWIEQRLNWALQGLAP